MNYLQEILGYLLGLYVPSVNSTSIILSLNKGNIDRLCRLRIMKIWSMIESTSLIMGYYGIRSNKTTLGEGIENYIEIDINAIIGIAGSILVILSIYILLINVYLAIDKGILYKVIGLGYCMAYILTEIEGNIMIICYLGIVSTASVYMLRKSPSELRSISFSLIGIMR